MHHSMQNTIFTKLLPWEYDNGDALFSWWKFGRVSCIAHQQGFMPVYMVRANMLMLGQAKAPQSIKHIDTCRIHEETNVTWWQGSGWSHHNDYAHNMTWICTYNKCLEHILMPQGQEHSLLERVDPVTMRVHHKKCTITHTHTQAYIYIYMHHSQSYHIKHIYNQTLPMFQGYNPYAWNVAQARSKKDIGYKERGNPNAML